MNIGLLRLRFWLESGGAFPWYMGGGGGGAVNAAVRRCQSVQAAAAAAAGGGGQDVMVGSSVTRTALNFIFVQLTGS